MICRAKLAVLLILVVVALLAACGQSAAPAASPSGTPTVPPVASATPTANPTATPPPPTPAATPTLAAPQWLPTAIPKETPTQEPTPATTLTPLPDSTPQPEKVSSEMVELIRFMHQAALLDDGRILVGGGFSGVANNNVVVPLPREDFQIYDPGTESWSLIVSEEYRAILSTTIGLSDDRYMSVGLGLSEEGEPAGVAGVFDAVTQSWAPLPLPTYIRGFPGMALLADGRVLVTGGLDFSDPTDFQFDILVETEVFDPRTEVWQQAAPMNNSAERQAVVSLQDGRVMVVQGGETAEIYDPVADSWTQTADMNGIPLIPEAVVLSDGRVLVTGVVPQELGFESDGTFEERCDPDTNTCVPVDPETGEDVEVSKPVAEIYDPATDTWTITEPMNEMRTSHTLTLLADGRVLAAGGASLSADEPHLTTETYDSTTNEWLPGPDMSEKRYDHTATLLPDGRVFLYGGITLEEDKQEVYPTYTHEFISVPASP